MRHAQLAFILALLSAPAFACPTCVGQRLGDARPQPGSTRMALSVSTGADWFGKGETRVGREEVRQDLSADVTLGLAMSVTARLPLLERTMVYQGVSEPTRVSVGDPTVSARIEVFRRAEARSSDTLRLIPAVQFPLQGPVTGNRGEMLPFIAQPTANAVTPSVALEYRHADQKWGTTVSLAGGYPVALPGAYRAGRWAQVTAGYDGQALEVLQWRVLLDVKAQEAASGPTGAIASTGYVSVFLGGELGWSPVKPLTVGAGVYVPLLCVSAGGYAHSPVYRASLAWVL